MHFFMAQQNWDLDIYLISYQKACIKFLCFYWKQLLFQYKLLGINHQQKGNKICCINNDNRNDVLEMCAVIIEFTNMVLITSVYRKIVMPWQNCRCILVWCRLFFFHCLKWCSLMYPCKNCCSDQKIIF